MLSVLPLRFPPIQARSNLKSALAAVTAAVVGVILNLTVTFAIDILSPTAQVRWIGPLHIYLPDLGALNWLAAALSAVALGLTFWLHRNIIETLAVCGGLALLAKWSGLV